MTDTSTAPAEQTDHDGHEPETDPTPSTAVAVVAPPAERSLSVLAGTDLPIIPAGKEMLALAQLANTLAGSGLVPRALQQRPNDVFQVLLTARDLGVAITTAVREFHVIEGKVTLSPKVKTAMVRERAHQMGWKLYPQTGNSADSCTWVAERDGSVFESTFTWAEARVAGMAGQDCEALNHSDVCKKAQPSRAGAALVCKSNWYSYPKRMLSWRALGYLMDDAFPEVGTGLYSPDELGAITDEDGNVLDLDSVEVPAGMTPTDRQAKANRPPDPRDALLADDVREGYRDRLKALPSAGFASARERWATQNAEGVPFLPILDQCKVRHVSKIEAVITDHERRAEKGEWGEWTKPTPPEAPKPDGDTPGTAATPPDSPPPVPDANGAADTPDAADEPTAPPTTSAPDAPVDPSYENDMLELDLLIQGFTAEARAEFTRRVAAEGIAAEDLHDEAKRRRSLAIADELTSNPPKPSCAVCGTTDDILVEHRGVRRCGNVKACADRVTAQAAANVAGDALPEQPEFDLDANDDSH